MAEQVLSISLYSKRFCARKKRLIGCDHWPELLRLEHSCGRINKFQKPCLSTDVAVYESLFCIERTTNCRVFFLCVFRIQWNLVDLSTPKLCDEKHCNERLLYKPYYNMWRELHFCTEQKKKNRTLIKRDESIGLLLMITPLKWVKIWFIRNRIVYQLFNARSKNPFVFSSQNLSTLEIVVRVSDFWFLFA